MPITNRPKSRRKEWDRSDAVTDILKADRSPRMTTASATRVMNACRGLGLNQAELIKVLLYLQFCDYQGRPFPTEVGVKAIKPVWLNKLRIVRRKK